jgi:hypothetical protein
VDRRAGFDDARLEQVLKDIGPRLAWPAEPQLARSVVAAIAAREPVQEKKRAHRFRPALAFGVAVLVVLFASLALVAFSPAAREAVADFLGIGGVRIEIGPTGPTPTARPGDNLFLGDETTLEEARERVDFQVRVPSVLGLPPEPNSVFYSDFPVGGRVSLVYRAQPDWLPEASTTGVGLLLTEFQGSLDGDLIKKSADHEVLVPTEVNGAPAFWVEGPHSLFYYDAKNRLRSESLRLSANALIWTQGGTTFRLESELNLSDALTIAESMR